MGSPMHAQSPQHGVNMSSPHHMGSPAHNVMMSQQHLGITSPQHATSPQHGVTSPHHVTSPQHMMYENQNQSPSQYNNVGGGAYNNGLHMDMMDNGMRVDSQPLPPTGVGLHWVGTLAFLSMLCVVLKLLDNFLREG